MGKVILDMAMSLDGIVTDKEGNYVYPIKKLRNSGELDNLIKNCGAVVMDKPWYDMANGDFSNYEYQVPIFVYTKRKPAKIAKGQNKNLRFTFITSSLKTAISEARKAGKGKNVMIVGGESIAQKALKERLVDTFILRIVPLFLMKGPRLLHNIGLEPLNVNVKETRASVYMTELKMAII